MGAITSQDPTRTHASSDSKSPNTSGAPPTVLPFTPWHYHLTLDLFARVLARSIFHPAIVLIFYLCLAAIHKHRSPTAYYTLYYAAFLSCVEVLLWVNRRVAYGWPRQVKWEEEVVVITGGGGGVGRGVVERLVRRGVKVAVLDVKAPGGEKGEEMEWVEELMDIGDLRWEKCDVGDEKGVEAAVGRIVQELGAPTILINNAAAPINGLPLIATSPSSSSSSTIRTLSPSQALHTLTTNTISHFTTLSFLLPHLTSPTSAPNGATILTISSILTSLHPAYLSDYAASKSAISSLHHSLTAEIQNHPDKHVRSKVKTVLVETGQIHTPLFERVKVPRWTHFFAPVLDSGAVAEEIVRNIERGEGGVVRMPFYAKVVPTFWEMVPVGVRRFLRIAVGVDRALI